MPGAIAGFVKTPRSVERIPIAVGEGSIFKALIGSVVLLIHRVEVSIGKPFALDEVSDVAGVLFAVRRTSTTQNQEFVEGIPLVPAITRGLV